MIYSYCYIIIFYTSGLFGGGSPKKPAPAPVVEEKKPPAKSSFGFFGAPKPAAPKQTPVVKKAPVAKKAPAKNPFASKPAAKKAAAPKDNIPVLSRFKQERDGSITGIVSNSKDFRAGTRITTSPIKGKAVAGTVVTTGSGSKYRLQ